MALSVELLVEGLVDCRWLCCDSSSSSPALWMSSEPKHINPQTVHRHIFVLLTHPPLHTNCSLPQTVLPSVHSYLPSSLPTRVPIKVMTTIKFAIIILL